MECSKSWYNTYCSATAKLWYMSECLGDRLEHSISVDLITYTIRECLELWGMQRN